MLELKNYMEVLVDQMFNTTTRDMDICRCERCKLDIMAIALNSLQPRYIVSDANDIHVKIAMLHQQFSTDIISALTKGTMLVNENRRHD